MSALNEIPPPLRLLDLKNGEEKGKRGLLFNCFLRFSGAGFRTVAIFIHHDVT
jgi:hypothetical protein